MTPDWDHVIIGHMAELLHVRRTDEHRGPLDGSDFCADCWRQATRQYLDERTEIRDAGTLFERERT